MQSLGQILHCFEKWKTCSTSKGVGIEKENVADMNRHLMKTFKTINVQTELLHTPFHFGQFYFYVWFWWICMKRPFRSNLNQRLEIKQDKHELICRQVERCEDTQEQKSGANKRNPVPISNGVYTNKILLRILMKQKTVDIFFFDSFVRSLSIHHFREKSVSLKIRGIQCNLHINISAGATW